MNQYQNQDLFKKGISASLICFVLWGLLPLYWLPLAHIPSDILVAYRILWSSLFLIFFIHYQKRWPEVINAFKEFKTICTLLFTGTLLGFNWLVFIYAVNNGYVIESSLGYYISPLMSIFLGLIFLREKVPFSQLIAIILATIGVLNAVIFYGNVPWIALLLAVSFSLYGLIRKVTNVAALPGLMIETVILIIPAALYLLYCQYSIGSHPDISVSIFTMVAGAGVVTTVPLILYNYGAKRIPLSTIGLLQFLAPTIMFMLGIFLLKEEFKTDDLITFSLIWLGVFIYMVDRYQQFRKKRQAIKKPQPSTQYVNISK